MMTDQRRGEIALMYIKARVRDKGLPCHPEAISRAIGNEAKHLGISNSEFAEFARLLYRELVDEAVAELGRIMASR